MLETFSQFDASLTAKWDTKADFNASGLVIMDLWSKNKSKYRVRALLDSGSGTNFISKDILPFLDFEKLGTHELMISGINATEKRFYDFVS